MRVIVGFAVLVASGLSACSEQNDNDAALRTKIQELKETASRAEQNCEDAKAYAASFPKTELKEDAKRSCELARTVRKVAKESEGRATKPD